MNCQDALDALATGGPLRRWLAARHLAGCPGCAKRADDFRRIVEALADVPPLTEAQRQSWMKAADAEAENVIPIRASTARRLAVAASILGLLALGGWLATRPAVPSPMIVVQTIDPILVKQVTLRDLDGLQAGASSLSKDLDDLLREVDLLDARRDVEALQLQFASLGGRPAP